MQAPGTISQEGKHKMIISLKTLWRRFAWAWYVRIAKLPFLHVHSDNCVQEWYFWGENCEDAGNRHILKGYLRCWRCFLDCSTTTPSMSQRSAEIQIRVRRQRKLKNECSRPSQHANTYILAPGLVKACQKLSHAHVYIRSNSSRHKEIQETSSIFHPLTRLDGRMAHDLTKNSTISSSDDTNVLRVGMAEKWEVSHHLVLHVRCTNVSKHDAKSWRSGSCIVKTCMRQDWTGFRSRRHARRAQCSGLLHPRSSSFRRCWSCIRQHPEGNNKVTQSTRMNQNSEYILGHSTRFADENERWPHLIVRLALEQDLIDLDGHGLSGPAQDTSE